MPWYLRVKNDIESSPTTELVCKHPDVGCGTPVQVLDADSVAVFVLYTSRMHEEVLLELPTIQTLWSELNLTLEGPEDSSGYWFILQPYC